LLKKTVNLIALDLDGTIVREDQSISAQDLEAIARAQMAGIPVVIATGRSFPTARRALSQLNVTTPVICSNGADIRFEGKSIYSRTIENGWLRKAYAAVEPFSYQRFVFCGEHIYCEKGNMHKSLFRKWGVESFNKDLMVFCNNADELMQMVGDLADKFLVCTEDESRYEEIQKLTDSFGYFDTVLGENLQFELTPKGVSKASALEFLVNRMGLSMQDVLAIGDSTNDLEMIRCVGTGIAMGNAMGELLAVADGVTLPVWENGVAHAIKKYVLQDEPCGVAFAG
jgi:5-amino-6-(5-phospho-D-ribitylamino)uracil phosphatase